MSTVYRISILHFEEVAMSEDLLLKDRTKKIFKETVDIYRNDLVALVNNPLPVIVAVVVLTLFLLAIGL